MADQQKNLSTASTFQRATVACQSCRIRKVKCDAQVSPSNKGCTPCRRAGQECMLDPSSDKRRSVSRKIVDKLQERIETLEALNQRAVGQSTWRIEEGGPSPSRDTRSGLSMQHVVDGTNTSPSPANDAVDLNLSSASNGKYQAASASSSVNGNSSTNPRHESPSFYGATSHPHVTSPGEESRLMHSDDVGLVGIDLDPRSPQLRNHLFRSFFRYQTLWVDVVSKETFFAHQADATNSQWCSKLLENAMLACGARLSTSKSVRGLAAKYLEWAKDDAMRAMSDPTPANLQGFLLLSEYEVTQGNDRPGWMFCGVACRMLSDLGVHELANISNTSREGEEHTTESDLAYGLLSACVVYEGVWTLYLGRPSSIPNSIMNVAASRCKANRKVDSPWLNAWVGLCIPMAEISHLLNERSSNGLDRTALLRKFLKQVEQWHENLSPELRYNETNLTNMDAAGYGLHTQYCKVQILLRRALDKPGHNRKRRYSEISSNGYRQTATEETNAVIYQYALRIARLVVTYRETFGMENIPSIMLDNGVVAATIMTAHLNKASSAVETQQQSIWLHQLMKSMESVQPHFPITGRMLDSLKPIRESTSTSNALQLTQYHSSDGSTNEISARNQTLNLRTRFDGTQGPSLEIGSNIDLAWDYFDMGVDLGTFPLPVDDNPLLEIPPRDVIMPT